MSNMRVLDGGAFGRCLGHDGSALMNGLRDPIEFPSPILLCMDIMRPLQQKTGPCLAILAPGIPASRIMRNKFLLFIRYIVCEYIVITTQTLRLDSFN